MRQLVLSIMFLVIINLANAQHKLSNSRESGMYTRIYRLTDKESFAIALQSSAVINDSFFHTLVDSFYYDNKAGYTGKLPYGNYLQVSAVKNQLVFRQMAVQNVQLSFINDLKNVQFVIKDLFGSIISDAEVKIGKNRTVNYNAEAHAYLTKSVPKQKVIRINYKGVTNYFNFDKIIDYWARQRARGSHITAPVVEKPAYKGYMVFNKPKYKPLDTVKFKTYLLTAAGKVIMNKPLRVEVMESGGYNNGNKPEDEEGTILGMINPYRDGGYTFDFVLADSLDLDLDENYSIVLKEMKDKKWEKVYSGNFRYEDYELKSVKFSVRADRQAFGPANPVTVFLSAKDENDLAVPDGRVVVNVIANNVHNYRDNHVFVPDSLWSTELKLEPVGETKLILPDSIFPNADVNFMLRSTFLNSNNESQDDTQYLNYTFKSTNIKSSLQRDSILLDYLINDKSTPVKAKLTTWYSAVLKADSAEVALPLLSKLDSRIYKYTINTADGYSQEILQNALYPNFAIAAVHTRDSLTIKVNNVQKLNFWYTLFSGNKIMMKGYTSRLDTVIKHASQQAAHIRVNYIWAGQELSQEVMSVFEPDLLNLKLKVPEMVYPGQVVDMEVKVTDVDQHPVAAADLTAYAFTAKFNEDHYIDLPNFSKAYKLRTILPGLQEVKLPADSQFKLNWQKWSAALALDTIAYYQFTHPAELYYISELSKDSAVTQVAPFVMKDGNIQPVHIVYIDDVPVFFSKTDQLQRYSFAVGPGLHRIGLRTANQMITFSQMIVHGEKTVVSVDADVQNTKAKVEDAPAELTEYESQLLSKYLFSIQDNFKDQKAIIEAGPELYLLNLPLANTNNSVKLIGPIKENYLKFLSGDIDQDFAKEPGYVYTFSKGLLKQKSYSSAYGFEKKLTEGIKKQTDNYKEEVLTKHEIDSVWNDYLDLRSYTTDLFRSYRSYSREGHLVMELDTAFARRMPYVKNILIFKNGQSQSGTILPGNTSWFPTFSEGTYKVMYLFKDNRYFTEVAVIKSGGKNYFRWSGRNLVKADSMSIAIDRFIKSAKSYNYYDNSNNEQIAIRVYEVFNNKYFDKKLLVEKVKGIVVDEHKVPVTGASVVIKGLTTGTVTNAKGEFELYTTKNSSLRINYIGYQQLEVDVKSSDLGTIILKEDQKSLEEIVVVGYGVQTKSNLTGSVTTMLAGAASGVTIRGISTIGSDKPMMIVDGMPFNGDINLINPSDIVSVNILKDAAATSIYGSRAAAGVVIIKTKKGNQVINEAGELVAQQQTMRSNFSDYAFWQPKLITNDEGVAKWKVRFPDDITNWSATVVAMNGNKQSGQLKTGIKSFKSLSANFVSPQFALAGDTIRVIGKLMNYTPLEEQVLRKFSYNGQELRNSTVRFKNSYIDTVAVVAAGKDSLSFKYTLEQGGGYFDGELRKIPVLPTGVVETKGYFDVLAKDTTVNYSFKPDAGKVTLYAEASVFPALLDEMDKLRKYEYLCNEQLASKLKALLMEKTVRNYLKTPFKNEKDIKDIIKKLQSAKRMEGTWGWWEKSPEQMWISLHVVQALLNAEKQGYAIELNKEVLYNYLVGRLANQSDQDRVFAIKLIHLLHPEFFIKDWVGSVEKQMVQRYQQTEYRKLKPTVYEQLQLMQLKQMAGLSIDMTALLSLHKSTMFGGMYWGEEGYGFWDNSIQNTMLAYQILKTDGKHPAELELIRRYFLEQRKNGQWRNTYESSLILETVLPDLLVKNEKPEPVSLVLNQTETIKDFPFTRIIDAAAAVRVSKKGGLPIYFTAYQQFLNPAPEKVSKDFTVKTSFIQQQAVVRKLKAGLKTILKIEVNVRADADYVMIEVPVPAGCSYDNKLQNYWGVETHREYFKHKTSIFCTKLNAGKYTFEIALIPRYSGNYTLNPAKAEMMYFPVFYGREGMKRIGIN